MSLAKQGKTSEALKILDCIGDKENLIGQYVRQEIYSRKGDFQRAFYETVKYDSIFYKFIRKRMQLGLISTVTNQLELEKELADTRAKATATQLWLIIIIAFLSLVGIICLVISIYRHQQKYKERNLQIVHELETLLRQNREKSIQTSTVLKKVLSSHQNVISDLNNVITQYGSTNAISAKLLGTVKKIIDEFSIDGESVSLLETQVNETYDNILTDLHTDLPKMKEADYRLFLFSLLGFSIPAIAVFLKEKKITAVYDRKRRLKDRIKSLDPIKSERYLVFLN